MDLQTVAQDIAAQYIPPDTGRPAAIGNADTVQELLEAIKNGNYLETAASLAGVSENAVRNWVKRGEAGEAPYDLFMRAYKRASAYAEAEDLGKVRKAGDDPRFWAANMTALERRHPERWARRQEGNDGPKVVVQIGVRDADVQVSLVSSNPLSSTLSPLDIKQLGE
jgi:hypothetical protein